MIKYEDKNYLNTNETAKFLGKTTTAFRQFLQRKKFPRRKLGGRLYFLQDDLHGYFARQAGDTYAHFEASGLGYHNVYSLEQLQKIILTTKQNIYHFLKKNNVTRYKDNHNKTLYNRAEIEILLGKLAHEVDDL
ncbi:MAG: helix-turn-helix domain-containing protein [Deltaproteobacteria bacterium]|nr:helix-turn-helix domain-containing protein [Deltaproteobacteria bacterium]